jgi:hypothetical protein
VRPGQIQVRPGRHIGMDYNEEERKNGALTLVSAT